MATFDSEGWIPIATVVGVSAEITSILFSDPATGFVSADPPVIELGQQTGILASAENTSPFRLRLRLSAMYEAPSGTRTPLVVEEQIVEPNGTFAGVFLFTPTELGDYTGFVILEGERA